MRIKVIDKIIIDNTFAYIVFEKPNYIKVQCGQFVNIKVPNKEVLIRRPFSIFEFNKNSFSILIKIIGKGTRGISLLEKGDYCDVLFPLGNGADKLLYNNDILFIAGGIGVAGINSFIQNTENYKLLFGDKNGEYKSVIDRFNIKCKYISESGKMGDKGIVTDYVKEFEYNTIIACGPKAMLKAVSKIDVDNIYVVYEEIMACGLGLCNGCAVKMKNGTYKLVCKDGPVFNAKEIDYE